MRRILGGFAPSSCENLVSVESVDLQEHHFAETLVFSGPFMGQDHGTRGHDQGPPTQPGNVLGGNKRELSQYIRIQGPQ